MTLPAWLEPLPDAEQMRAIDAWAIDNRGVPSIDLMERAGAGLARLVAELVPDGRLVAVCGKGNNGGDGLVAARILREQARHVDVEFAGDPAELRGDAAINLERLPGDPPRTLDGPLPAGVAGVIDALLGTGFAGEPRGPVASAIAAIVASDATIVSADVPSGVDASTGEVAAGAVKARATATFHAAKPGLWIAPGKWHAGETRAIEIGIPHGAPPDPAIGLIRPAVIDRIPRRGAGWTKFTSGYVVVAGGSAGLTGAPCLVAEAAMRAGAGYVTVCVPQSLALVFESRLLEVMTRSLQDDDSRHTPDGVEAVLEATQRAGALVLGPGLGRSDGAQEFARTLVRRAELPIVLDADGLNAHAESGLPQRQAPMVLTPHEGELGRLLGIPSDEIAAARLRHAQMAARRFAATVVLKGDDTLVATPSGEVAVSPGGTPALATAGTGDVLSGVIGAMLARRLDPFTAACAGVLAHSHAGRRAADLLGAEGVIASDVIAALPRALTG